MSMNNESLQTFVDYLINNQLCLDLFCRHIIEVLFVNNNIADIEGEWTRIFEKDLSFCVEIRQVPTNSLTSGSNFKSFIKVFGWDELGEIQFKHLPNVECRMFVQQLVKGKSFLLIDSTHPTMKKDVLYSAFTGNTFLNQLSAEYKETIKTNLQDNILKRAQQLNFNDGERNRQCRQRIERLQAMINGSQEPVVEENK